MMVDKVTEVVQPDLEGVDISSPSPPRILTARAHPPCFSLSNSPPHSAAHLEVYSMTLSTRTVLLAFWIGFFI